MLSCIQIQFERFDISFLIEKYNRRSIPYLNYHLALLFLTFRIFSASPYGKTKRLRWKESERSIIYKEFQSVLSKHKPSPSTRDIKHVKSKHPELQHRSVAQIRTWIHNHISGKTKKR